MRPADPLPEAPLRLLLDLTAAVSEAADLHEALGHVIETVCAATGWPYGEAWLVGADGGLTPGPARRVGAPEIAAFRAAAEGLALDLQRSLPARACASRVPAWDDGLLGEPPPRAELARSLVRTAVAIPVLAGADAVAAMVFYLPGDAGDRDGAVALVSVAAAQLGQWFRRKRAEDEVRAREERLARLVKELERSNADLEAFAALASHDLQEPLRKIIAFGDRLQGHLGASLDERGALYLDRMVGAARRMRALIQGLLAYSQVAGAPPAFAPVDLAAVAREVLGDLEAVIERRGASVEVGELPRVRADATQMRQLLQNLLGNAVKFHPAGARPRVRVAARRIAPEAGGVARWELSVEDDGIGFDEQHLERIFGMLQRLHGRDEYEGTGMGLALCRRIVERHGGEITARSAPGRGATFVVTLPEAPGRAGGRRCQ